MLTPCAPKITFRSIFDPRGFYSRQGNVLRLHWKYKDCNQRGNTSYYTSLGKLQFYGTIIQGHNYATSYLSYLRLTVHACTHTHTFHLQGTKVLESGCHKAQMPALRVFLTTLAKFRTGDSRCPWWPPFVEYVLNTSIVWAYILTSQLILSAFNLGGGL